MNFFKCRVIFFNQLVCFNWSNVNQRRRVDIALSLNVIDNVKDYIASAPEAKDVASFAELLKAASANIEALNKVYISRERNKTQKELKLMEIETKKEINSQDNATFLLSRKELMQELINKSKSKSDSPVIDI